MLNAHQQLFMYSSFGRNNQRSGFHYRTFLDSDGHGELVEW